MRTTAIMLFSATAQRNAADASCAGRVVCSWREATCGVLCLLDGPPVAVRVSPPVWLRDVPAAEDGPLVEVGGGLPPAGVVEPAAEDGEQVV